MLTMSEIPAYVLDKYGIEITRQTAYNWTTRGIRGETLPTIAGVSTRIVRKGEVDKFVETHIRR